MKHLEGLTMLKELEEQIVSTMKALQDSDKYNARGLAVAKTHLETGLLRLNHSTQRQQCMQIDDDNK